MRFSARCQLPGKWLDHLKYFGDPPFVMRKHDALGQNVGNNQQPLRGHRPDLDRSSRRDLILIFVCKSYDRDFFLVSIKPA
jgi:hypothetical protein